MTVNRNSAGIIGLGHYVPENKITNFDLEKMVDTNDAWIVERTGIRERRAAAPETPVSALGYRAAMQAIADANIDPAELDLVIFATLTPDRIIPATACVIQDKIGATRAAAFDLSAACSGFAYASAIACQFIESGVYRNILVIGAETLTKCVDYTDRDTCILFGDGAGAAVYGIVDDGLGMLAFDLGSDGSGAEALDIPSSGSLRPVSHEMLDAKQNFIHMDGKAVYRFATKVMGKTVLESLKKIDMKTEEIDHLVPHQANIRIIEAAANRLNMPMEKVVVNIASYGNMSAASIPVALSEAYQAGRFKKGDVVALAGFGAGLTWASCIMKWAKGGAE